jgi:hypothetical protein
MPEDDATYYDLQQRLKAAIEGVLQGTDFVPTEPAFLVDCVVIMGWSDGQGNWGSSHIRCGSPWATAGLVQDMAADIDSGGQYDIIID